MVNCYPFLLIVAVVASSFGLMFNLIFLSSSILGAQFRLFEIDRISHRLRVHVSFISSHIMYNISMDRCDHRSDSCSRFNPEALAVDNFKNQFAMDDFLLYMYILPRGLHPIWICYLCLNRLNFAYMILSSSKKKEVIFTLFTLNDI